MNGLPCHYEGVYDEARLTSEVRIDLFRICQECLLNASNHAQASHVKVSVKDLGNRIQLVVVDDGKGFDVEQGRRKPGFIRMRERAASINGELTIESRAGEGTMVCVSIAKL